MYRTDYQCTSGVNVFNSFFALLMNSYNKTGIDIFLMLEEHFIFNTI